MAVAAMAAAVALRAQEPGKIKVEHRDTIREGWEFYVPDSLSHQMPWRPDYRRIEMGYTRPVVSMSSVVVAPPAINVPSSVMVLNNNTLRLGNYFNLSVGQAQLWGPYPDSYLDARTLSMPMP